MNKELRLCERQDGLEWTVVQMSDLKKDDVFRLFEDGEQVAQGPWVALGEPFKDDGGTWSIVCKPERNEE